MLNKSEVGYADYVLLGDDGRVLAVIEAKRTCVDVAKGRQQAKLYADSAASSILILFCPYIYHSVIIVCLLFCYLYQARNFLEVGTNFISTKLSSI